MSNQSGCAKLVSVRDCLVIGTYVVTLLVGTSLVVGTSKLTDHGAEATETTTWAELLPGDAASLVVIALIGVVLISRRHLPL